MLENPNQMSLREEVQKKLLELQIVKPDGISEEDFLLIYAIKLDLFSLVKKMLNAGANPNAVIPEALSNPALSLAILSGNVEIVDHLLRSGASPDTLSCTGGNPLMTALLTNKEEVFNYLFDRNFDTDTPDNGGNTLLTFSAEKGFFKIAEKILKKSCRSIDYKINYDISFAEGPDLAKGSTALIIAAFKGYTQMVELLLKYGANPNVTDDLGRNAAEIAELRGHPSVAHTIEERLENEALETPEQLKEINLRKLRDLHESLKESASSNLKIANIEVKKSEVARLLQLTAEMAGESFYPQQDGFTPLHFVARFGELEDCKALIASGADVNAKTTEQKISVLDLAVRGNHKLLFEEVLKHSNFETNTGALKVANEMNRTDFFKKILESEVTCAGFAELFSKDRGEWRKGLGLTAGTQNSAAINRLEEITPPKKAPAKKRVKNPKTKAVDGSAEIDLSSLELTKLEPEDPEPEADVELEAVQLSIPELIELEPEDSEQEDDFLEIEKLAKELATPPTELVCPEPVKNSFPASKETELSALPIESFFDENDRVIEFGEIELAVIQSEKESENSEKDESEKDEIFVQAEESSLNPNASAFVPKDFVKLAPEKRQELGSQKP